MLLEREEEEKARPGECWMYLENRHIEEHISFVEAFWFSGKKAESSSW